MRNELNVITAVAVAVAIDVNCQPGAVVVCVLVLGLGFCWCEIVETIGTQTGCFDNISCTWDGVYVR